MEYYPFFFSRYGNSTISSTTRSSQVNFPPFFERNSITPSTSSSRSRGSRCDADRRASIRPRKVDIFIGVDQIWFFTKSFRKMSKLGWIRGFLRTDDEDGIYSFSKDRYCLLTIGRRIADVTCLWKDAIWVFHLYCVDENLCLSDREGCLTKKSEKRILWDFLDITFWLDESKKSFSFIDDSHRFLMSLFPDIDNVISFFKKI